MENKKEFITPSTRFIPDTDERGVIITDPRTGDFKSGFFEIKLEKSTINGSSEYVTSYREHMNFNKYKGIAEDIHTLNVEGLRKYFPALNEKTSQSDSEQSTGKTDAGESGEKDSAKEASSTDKAKS
jgi:hypothetical protein